jgi:hypothetical protein
MLLQTLKVVDERFPVPARALREASETIDLATKSSYLLSKNSNDASVGPWLKSHSKTAEENAAPSIKRKWAWVRQQTETIKN